jgi:hypothetical protein
MVEGSRYRSISISLTNEFGSGRPKNMWIRWIRIRIRICNTALLRIRIRLPKNVSVDLDHSAFRNHRNILYRYCSGEISGGGREATARGGGGQVRGQPHTRGQVPQEQQGQEGVPHQVCRIESVPTVASVASCSIVRSVVRSHQCFGSN